MHEDVPEPLLERLSAVVTELFNAANHALLNERGPAEACMQRAGAFLQKNAVMSASLQNPAANPPQPNTQIRGGLAPWQIRKLITYVDVNLDRTITTRCLAEVARLSAFHFCRAFRDSFGDSPHGYVIRRRMERAQGLMLTTNASLGQIAADCGLADQAHFNKLFRKFAGESPGAWRRARANGALRRPYNPL
jgi:transcriptional regulator GlxA family with amidase domain